ncbi:GNAT family protein [Brevundimonas sp. 2R-24]|uniref:GNAT family protein n=1 Tax=Peiella sedimenti TaxID=3061083 RepID=A0ABT8SJ81_9CAUL|nr:GNAT family protein [Caulobacteraceae bacterium XZ-24]
MAVLDWMQTDHGPVLQDTVVRLRLPRQADYPAWSDLRRKSEAYLRPWEPKWPEDDLTRAAFRRRLSVYAREVEAERAWPFFIFDDAGLVGAITLSNVRRGVADAGTLGYWIGQPHAGRGLATRAVRLMAGYAFDTLGLHRLEAACVPENTASRRVLEKSAFRLEGVARAYLNINGAWRDHLLFARLEDDVAAGSNTRGLHRT